MCLKNYIPNADKYSTYEIANKIENNPNFWIDKIDDEQIEVHSSNYNGEVFRNELTSFINNNILNCNIQMENERLFINKRYVKVPYCIISNIQPLNGEMS